MFSVHVTDRHSEETLFHLQVQCETEPVPTKLMGVAFYSRQQFFLYFQPCINEVPPFNITVKIATLLV